MSPHLNGYRLFVFFLFFSLGCSSTKFNIRTEPSNAETKIYSETGMKDKVVSDVEYEIQNMDDFFRDKNGRDLKQSTVGLEIEKEGYRRGFYAFNIQKGKKGEANSPAVIFLEKLDTEISIEGDPPGAAVSFYQSRKEARLGDKERAVPIPPEEYMIVNEEHLFRQYFEKFVPTAKIQKSDRIAHFVISPWQEEFSADTIREFALDKNVQWVRIHKEGYIPVIREFNVVKGESNRFSYKLREMATTLKVVSDQDGIEVEDIRKDTGFGYLGKTPFARTFTYEDCVNRPEFNRDLRIYLTLKCSKEGYVDEYQVVEIPMGEEMTVKVSPNPLATQITFQTDPPETHVYVKRTRASKELNKESNKIEERPIDFLKHLGTTPFTYYMDTADPLRHGDTIVYRKTGYQEDADRFVQGVTNYHKVLEPVKVKER